MGACVEARDKDSASFSGSEGSGDPVVCHLVATDGTNITDVRAVTWTTEEWADGAVTKTPMNPGMVIAGTSIDGTAVGYGEKRIKTTEVEETEVVEEGEEAEEYEEEEEEETDFQDDDGWNDEASEEETDEAIEDAEADGMNDSDQNSAVTEAAESTEAEETEEVAAEAPKEEEKKPKTAIPRSINFHWFQPNFGASYSNLRRFGAGNNVQAYALPLQAGADSPFEPFPIGEVMVLAEATKLIAAAGVIVTAALAF